MWIVRLALRRPYTVLVSVLLVFLFGVLSLQRLKRDILPNIDIPVVIVIWSFPGLSAEDMERRVVFITERAFSTTVNGISRIESQSLAGIGLLKVYFEDGTDIGAAIAQISAVTNTLLRSLPPGMTPPAILQFNASNVQVAQLTLRSETVSEQALFDYGFNFLRLRLFTIPGLATPAPYGGRSRQIMVDIDPAKVKSRGISPQDVVTALLSSNVILPAGTARIGSLEYDVLLNASPLEVAEFNTMPIKVVNGAPVLMRDVAFVHDGYAVQSNIVRVNGRRATYLSILRKSGASTVAVVDAVRELLPAIQAAAPEGIELSIDFDQSMFVRAAISGVLREAALAAGLVSLMIFFFLGSWRSMLIVCTSIPVAIVSGIVGLFLTGQTLNLMTLGGLALAVGMLVDDATVEVENIHRNRLMGKRLTVAILDAAHQVAVPALAATLTVCIVFFPVVMLEGPARFLFIPLALSVVFSMVASYLLSRTLVPSLSRRLMERQDERGEEDGQRGLLGRFNAWRDRGFERFRSGYARVLTACIAHPRKLLPGALLFAAVGMSLVGVVGLDFFPRVDSGQMRLHVRAPTGQRIEDTELDVGRVEQEIRRIIPAGELRTINDNIGVPTFYNLAFVSSDNAGGWDAEILVQLAEKHGPTARYMERIRGEIAAKFPTLKLYFAPADVVTQVLNFGVSSMIDIQIESRDAAGAFEVARHLFDQVRRVPGAQDVRIAQVFDRPALRLAIDRQRAAQLNLTVRDVANSMLTSLSSSSLVAPSFWVDPKTGTNYNVVVQTPIVEVASVADLMATAVTPATGGITTVDTTTNAPSFTPPVQPQPSALLPASNNAPYLGGLARVSPSVDRASISHYTVQPIVDVQASVQGRDLGGVTRDIRRIMAATKLPPGTRLHLRGQSETMATSFRDLGAGMLVAVILVYLLLVVLFQSLRDPLIVMVAVPGAFVGILWMLTLTGTTLNVESFMGAIMAIGIAVSNSILLVSFANQARAEREGMPAAEAALVAGETRLRPVLMTALAMVLGMLPMAVGLGEGGEQNAPLGRAVIGGLLMATLSTLFVVPTVYAALRRKPPTAHELDKRLARESQGWNRPGAGGGPKVSEKMSEKVSEQPSVQPPQPDPRPPSGTPPLGTPPPPGFRRIGVTLVVAIVCAAVVVLVMYVRGHRRLGDEASARASEVDRGPRVYVARVRATPGAREVHLAGDVRAFYQSTIYAKVAGYVKSIDVDKGDPVRKGQVLGLLESPEVDQQVAAAQSDAMVKQVTYERYRRLVAKDYVSKQDLDTVRAQYEVSLASLRQARALQKYKVLRAPFDGTVTARYVDPGALIPAGTGSTAGALPLVDVADLRRLRVMVFVQQDVAPFVRVGDPVTIREDGDPAATIDATVSRMARSIDPRSRTMLCEIWLENRERLYGGTFVDVTLNLRAEPLPTVPSTALLLRNDRTVVAAVRGSRVKFQPVETGIDDGKTVQIRTGVKVGEVVALNLPSEVLDGALVQALPAPLPPNAGPSQPAPGPRQGRGGRPSRHQEP